MAHVPPFPTPLDNHSAASLALQACDDIDSLHLVHRAYACIDKLIGAQRVADSEEIQPSRTELSALVQLVNDELQRRIEATEVTMQSLRTLLGEGAVPQG